MTPFIDALIALSVVSGLSVTVIAITQGRRAWPWLLLALLTGPIAPVMLLARGSPHGATADARLCAECFERLTCEHGLCPRCREPRRKPSRA